MWLPMTSVAMGFVASTMRGVYDVPRAGAKLVQKLIFFGGVLPKNTVKTMVSRTGAFLPNATTY